MIPTQGREISEVSDDFGGYFDVRLAEADASAECCCHLHVEQVRHVQVGI